MTREKAQEREKAPWTSRSPLSFWAPSLLLTPLAVVLGFYGLTRRDALAGRSRVEHDREQPGREPEVALPQLVPAGAKCRVRFLKLGPDPAGGPATPARPNS